jgi:hypothetical protein
MLKVHAVRRFYESVPMPPGRCDSHAVRRARALAEAVAAVGDELRLVDVAHYISYIRNEQMASLQDIVSSSVELYFKPGTLTFGWAASCEVDWTTPPTIILGMEFRHRDVWMVFQLILRAETTNIRIEHLVVSASNATQAEETERLIEAIADARLSGPDHRGTA